LKKLLMGVFQNKKKTGGIPRQKRTGFRGGKKGPLGKGNLGEKSKKTKRGEKKKEEG